MSVFATWDGYDGEYVQFAQAEQMWLRETGKAELQAFDEHDQLASAGFARALEKAYPSTVLDLVEAFLRVLPSDEATKCERQLNEALANHRSEWRLENRMFFKMSSGYLEEEVLSRAATLLREVPFRGPLEEFNEARTALAEDDNEKAVVWAGKALESTMKCVLGKEYERARPRQLFQGLRDSGLIPKYYVGFFGNLQAMIEAIVQERSEPGRAHGQGPELREVPRELAALTLHLTACFIVFLTEAHLRRRGEAGNENIGNE